MFLNVLIRLADPCSIIEGTVRLYRFASLTIKKVFHLTKNNTISDVFNTLQTKLWTMLTLLINPITWPIFYGGTSYHEELYQNLDSKLQKIFSYFKDIKVTYWSVIQTFLTPLSIQTNLYKVSIFNTWNEAI